MAARSVLPLGLMFFIFVLLFAWTVWAVLLWGSIRIVDRTNQHNSFVAALVWSAVQLGVSLGVQTLGMAGLGVLVLWLAFLLRLLLRQYEMSIAPALLVLVMLIAAPFGLAPALEVIVGTSELLALLVLCGTPFAIIGGWLFGRYRQRSRGDDDSLPVARVFRRKRAEPRPAAVTPVVAVMPVAPPPPPAPPPRDAAAPGEPTLLR
jgi:hypothetical protein